MPLPVAHRRWLFNAVWCTALVLATALIGALGSPAGWCLCASLPLAAISWVGWWKTRPRRPRPDYARISELEAELFPPCPHAGAGWVWSERRGKSWYCSACPPPDFAPNVKDVEALLSKLEGTFAPIRKPQPPPGRGAGSPTRRQ
jgi:hypothetical protein